MTLQKDQDPGWWRRGMSKRAITIVTVVAIVVLVGALIFMAASGIPLF
jgi:hypothetical protein